MNQGNSICLFPVLSFVVSGFPWPMSHRRGNEKPGTGNRKLKTGQATTRDRPEART